jgi:arylsulfatase A-like enzyme
MVFSTLWHSITLCSVLSMSFISRVSAQDAIQQPIGSPAETGKRPNVVFILTDDQDLHMDSLNYMPLVQKHLIDQGTFYKRHFCTIALCCPSRVSLWTGKAAHNTNVTDVNPPYGRSALEGFIVRESPRADPSFKGGYPKFISQGLNEAYLPVWLQDVGYRTYYIGKLFNAHTIDNYNDPYPAGFTGSDFLLDPHTYEYLNASFQRNKSPPKSYEGQYSTDVVASKAYSFLDQAAASEDPFFITIAPVACHSNVKFGQIVFNGSFDIDHVVTSPPIPAERHKGLFPNAIIPRNANFNPKKASKSTLSERNGKSIDRFPKPSSVNWIHTLPQQNETNVEFNDHFYRNRLRALQAVDEIVDGIITRLDEYGILDNTYIVYSTDNGYHISQHRLQPGKECGFEEDINVPLIIRGPGVLKGEVTDIVTTHTDLAPTFLNLIGEKPRPEFDGVAIPVTETGLKEAKEKRHEHVNVEYWGFAITEGKYDKQIFWNNTYKSLRVIGKGYNLYYSVWCNNEHELYDLNVSVTEQLQTCPEFCFYPH